jgi:hypothetical protein
MIRLTMVRGSATPVLKKMLIPGLIFGITLSGGTNRDFQFALPGFMEKSFRSGG